MSREKLAIAMDLIEALAKQMPSSYADAPDNLEQRSVKRIIEAARSSYVLPSYCAEMNMDAKKCIQCIVEHVPPAICLEKLNEPCSEDVDIEWDTPKE